MKKHINIFNVKPPRARGPQGRGRYTARRHDKTCQGPEARRAEDEKTEETEKCKMEIGERFENGKCGKLERMSERMKSNFLENHE